MQKLKKSEIGDEINSINLKFHRFTLSWNMIFLITNIKYIKSITTLKWIHTWKNFSFFIFCVSERTSIIHIVIRDFFPFSKFLYLSRYWSDPSLQRAIDSGNTSTEDLSWTRDSFFSLSYNNPRWYVFSIFISYNKSKNTSIMYYITLNTTFFIKYFCCCFS